MTKQERNQVLQWIIEDKCQYKAGKGNDAEWVDYPFADDDYGRVTVRLDESFDFYRIKPTPTLRPWKAEEVPGGALLRSVKWPDIEYIIMGRRSASGYSGDGWVQISVPNTVRGGWQDYQTTDCEHSLDHGKTWLPCGVME